MKKKTFVKNIIKIIHNDIKLYKKFYNKTKNRKYKIKELCNYIYLILKTGMSFRDINEFNIKNIPHWNTIYKFFEKLIKYNVIYTTFLDTVKKLKKYNKFLTDTTIIQNKGGIQDIGYNLQLPKHKCTKILLITNSEGKILSTDIYSGNVHDSKIFINQFQKFDIFNPNNQNILIGDSAYDSNLIRKKLNEKNFGILLAPKNKRNTKNLKKINSYKFTKKQKKIIKNRIKIENTNNFLKKFKRLSLRYDKKKLLF
jgi:transposase